MAASVWMKFSNDDESADCRNHTDRDGVLHVERIARGQHPLTNTNSGRVAEIEMRKIMIRFHNPEQCDVGGRVGAHNLHPVLGLLVGESHPNLVRILDHVVVGENFTGRRDKEARARGPLHSRLALPALVAWAEEEVERIIGHLLPLFGRLLNVGGVHRDHRRNNVIGKGYEIRQHHAARSGRRHRVRAVGADLLGDVQTTREHHAEENRRNDHRGERKYFVGISFHFCFPPKTDVFRTHRHLSGYATAKSLPTFPY